jgi:LEA14-like dessication related protein
MKNPWIKVLSLLTFCLFFAACGINNKIGNVLVDLLACAPTAQEAQFKLTLRYTNENVFAIAISQTEGKLYLNDEYVGTYVNRSPVGIPQLTSLTREGTLNVEKPEVLQKILSSSASAVAYRLESVMRMEISEDKSKLKSLTNGQIEAASLRAPAVAK